MMGEEILQKFHNIFTNVPAKVVEKAPSNLSIKFRYEVDRVENSQCLERRVIKNKGYTTVEVIRNKTPS